MSRNNKYYDDDDMYDYDDDDDFVPRKPKAPTTKSTVAATAKSVTTKPKAGPKSSTSAQQAATKLNSNSNTAAISSNIPAVHTKSQTTRPASEPIHGTITTSENTSATSAEDTVFQKISCTASLPNHTSNATLEYENFSDEDINKDDPKMKSFSQQDNETKSNIAVIVTG